MVRKSQTRAVVDTFTTVNTLPKGLTTPWPNTLLTLENWLPIPSNPVEKCYPASPPVEYPLLREPTLCPRRTDGWEEDTNRVIPFPHPASGEGRGVGADGREDGIVDRCVVSGWTGTASESTREKTTTIASA